MEEFGEMKNMTNESHLQFYMRWHRLALPYFRWQFEQFQPHLGNRIADVGCGPGNLTSFMQDKEFYLGVDIDEDLLKVLKEENSHAAVHAQRTSVVAPEFTKILTEQKIDTIICANLIEHLPDDVLALKNMIDALPRGGALCLLVPAFQQLFGTLDKLDGHYRRYTKRLLKTKISKMSVVVQKMYYFNMVGALGWWVKGRLLKREAHDDDNYTLMNKVLPIVSRLESIVMPPFGLSLVAILRRI